MRNPKGYSRIESPMSSRVKIYGVEEFECVEGTTELDTFTCFHCGSIVHVAARQDPTAIGGLCKSCMGLICPRCLDQGCSPLERKLEEAERRDIALRSYGF